MLLCASRRRPRARLFARRANGQAKARLAFAPYPPARTVRRNMLRRHVMWSHAERMRGLKGPFGGRIRFSTARIGPMCMFDSHRMSLKAEAAKAKNKTASQRACCPEAPRDVFEAAPKFAPNLAKVACFSRRRPPRWKGFLQIRRS